MKVYIDESGFTGADYCNKEQPLFVLACNWFEDDSSDKIEKDIISKFDCLEVKFSKLVRTGKGKTELIKIIDYFNGKEAQSKYAAYVVHKKSALVRKFVLDCIEPTLHLSGIDMLEDGMSVAYANLISSVMPALMGGDWYNDFLFLYNQLIRSRKATDNKELYKHCQITVKNKEALNILLPYLNRPDLVMDELNSPIYRVDMYDQILLGLITHIRHMFGVTDFNVSLDSTKTTTVIELSNLLKRLELLTKTHRMSEVCTLHPDIKVSEIHMVDSEQVIGVRMSDLVAGLFSWSFKSVENMNSMIATALKLKITDKNMIHMFNTNNVTPEDLGMSGTANPWK